MGRAPTEVSDVHRFSPDKPVRWVAVSLLCLFLASRALIGGQDKPLPDKKFFLEEVRKRLKSDDLLQGQYTYRERQVRLDYDGNGRVETKVTKEFEVYPSVDGSPSYRRLIATNGVPEPSTRLAEADRKHREKLQEWARDRQAESPSVRARRELREKRERDKEARVVDDILRVYDIRMTGREEIRGRPAIGLSFTPRPGVRPLVEDAAAMTKVEGRAWVDEHDYELVRIEVEATDGINVGLGLLARIGRGTTLAFERQKVNGEAWLPARVEVRPKARIALVKRIDANIVSEYRDYRKFTVEAALEFAMPKK